MQFTMLRRFNIQARILLLSLLCCLFIGNATAEESGGDTSDFVVYKHPLCFCCKKWIKHLQDNKLQASSIFKVDMQAIKRQWGIPRGMEGCHTAVWQGRFVFEGHVPAQYIQKFLASPPEGGIGLIVPGMPIGSPGMEVKNQFESYNIYLLLRDGDYRLYARIENPDAV